CGRDDRLGAEIHAFLAEFLRMARNGDAALPHARAAVELAEQVGDVGLLADALATFGLLEFNAGRGIPAAEMARALELEAAGPSRGAASAVHAHQLFWSGRLDEARGLLAALIDDCRRRDLPDHEPLWYLSQVEFRAGHWEQARVHAEASFA